MEASSGIALCWYRVETINFKTAHSAYGKDKKGGRENEGKNDS